MSKISFLFPIIYRNSLLWTLRKLAIAAAAICGIVFLFLAGLWEEVKDRLDESALTLSGGQQQRLCLARALSLDPEVILMDEPCSALDPISTGTIEELILALRSQTSVIIVTHNLAQARRISDQTGIFWTNKNGEGELVEFGNTSQIFSRPKTEIAAAYISGLKG